jgi:hypothetical protein
MNFQVIWKQDVGPHMQTHTLAWRGYEIAVQPERNEFGAWRAKVSVRKASETVAEFRPETVQPEWLTEAEAVRDGFDWGRRFIRQKMEASADAV